jgi:hypothetical protein
MQDNPRTASEPATAPRWQEKAIWRLSLMATAMGIAAMIVGALVNWWLPGPSHSVFPASFGLLLVMIAMVRHAYL